MVWFYVNIFFLWKKTSNIFDLLLVINWLAIKEIDKYLHPLFGDTLELEVLTITGWISGIFATYIQGQVTLVYDQPAKQMTSASVVLCVY